SRARSGAGVARPVMLSNRPMKPMGWIAALMLLGSACATVPERAAGPCTGGPVTREGVLHAVWDDGSVMWHLVSADGSIALELGKVGREEAFELDRTRVTVEGTTSEDRRLMCVTRLRRAAGGSR